MKNFFIKHKIFVCISSVCLVALLCCGAFFLMREGGLAEVKNVRVDDDAYVRWSEVDGATRYVVNINGKTYQTEQTQLDVFNIFTELGTYDIEVAAYSSRDDVSPSLSESITYDVNLDGIGYVVESDRCVLSVSDKEKLSPVLVIPKAINGVLVSETGLFSECDKIGSLYIQDGVQVSAKAFSDCKNLKRIRLSTNTGVSGFYGCTALTSITISDGVTSIGLYAFEGGTALTSITIPNGVTSVGDYAFKGCTSLTGITIPDGVTSIGKYTFRGCTALTSITIPEGVESLDLGAFYCCRLDSLYIPSSVKEIEPCGLSAESLIVSDENPWFFSENNCIVDRETRVVVSGCLSANLSFPDYVIGEKAFRYGLFDGDLFVNAKEIGGKSLFKLL